MRRAGKTTIRMTLSRAHTSGKAADVAKLLNKRMRGAAT